MAVVAGYPACLRRTRGSFRCAVAAETLGGLVPAAAVPRGGKRSGRTVRMILGCAPSGGHKDLYARIYSRARGCATLARSPCKQSGFRRGSARASCSTKMRILIAEDEKRLAGAIARGLRREGMAVDITHDGASALVQARVVDYDVVVLDRDLPELHGDEVCRLLSTDERETKVLMLTAADTTDDLVDGLALGADDYLPKPFHWPELV